MQLSVGRRYQNLSAAVVVTSPPAGLYVDADYVGGNGIGTVDQPFTTISQALAVALPFDRIYVDPAAGPYVENVIVQTSGIVIRGVSWTQPTGPRPILMPPPGPGAGDTVQVMDDIGRRPTPLRWPMCSDRPA